MGRILGIDYGKVRTGLALSDSSETIASPLKTFKMATTAVKEWNNDEFLAYTLLFSAKADFVSTIEKRNIN